jgi:hypothetical protein
VGVFQGKRSSRTREGDCESDRGVRPACKPGRSGTTSRQWASCELPDLFVLRTIGQWAIYWDICCEVYRDIKRTQEGRVDRVARESSTKEGGREVHPANERRSGVDLQCVGAVVGQQQVQAEATDADAKRCRKKAQDVESQSSSRAERRKANEGEIYAKTNRSSGRALFSQDVETKSIRGIRKPEKGKSKKGPQNGRRKRSGKANIKGDEESNRRAEKGK